MQQSHVVLRLGDWRGFGNYFQHLAPSFAWKDLSHPIPRRGRNLKAQGRKVLGILSEQKDAASGKVHPSLGDSFWKLGTWRSKRSLQAAQQVGELPSWAEQLLQQALCFSAQAWNSNSLLIPRLCCHAVLPNLCIKWRTPCAANVLNGGDFLFYQNKTERLLSIGSNSKQQNTAWLRHLNVTASLTEEFQEVWSKWQNGWMTVMEGFQESVCMRHTECKSQVKINFKLMIHSFLSTVAEWRDGNWTWKCGLSLPLWNKSFLTVGSHWRGISVL